MARMAFKPDSSFFRKIAMGAVGARSVCQDLARHGHAIVELERGATDTKLWKDVKRKRVRIPDLVCLNCGLRVESRAKTDTDLTMSHSPTEESRAWDFGMVGEDLIAFPICEVRAEETWTNGVLNDGLSDWHERNQIEWHLSGRINYFRVESFRSTPPARTNTKGVTEGSETAISWNAVFSSRDGTVERAADDRITIRRTSDGHRYTWKVPLGQRVVVTNGEEVSENQVIASSVEPVAALALRCPEVHSQAWLEQCLSSRERTIRFTGVKLARLTQNSAPQELIRNLGNDPVEDVYTRLEAASYLVAVCGESCESLFGEYCQSNDPQTQLEAVIALGEAATPDAVAKLAAILHDTSQAYFLRSAAAWSLARTPSPQAVSHLVRAFSDVDPDLREEALDGIMAIGGTAVPLLAAGLRDADSNVAAGSAEALRRQSDLSDDALSAILAGLSEGKSSTWTAWLLGHLPRERLATAASDLQVSAPELHFAINVMWAFAESWIARNWEFWPAGHRKESARV